MNEQNVDANQVFRKKLTIAAVIFGVIGVLNIILGFVSSSGLVGLIAAIVWLSCAGYSVYISRT